MANPSDRVDRIRKILSLEPECHIDQADQHRHFHQRADYRSKSLPGVDAEHRHRHGNGKLEIIGGRREAQRGGLFIGGPDLH